MTGGHDPASVPMLFFVVYLASGGDAFFTQYTQEEDSRPPPFSLAVEGGAQEICERLASRLGRTAKPGSSNVEDAAVVLGQQAESVTTTGKEDETSAATVVTTKDVESGRRRRWRCRRLVCTVPPHALRLLRFEPRLPDAVRHAAEAMTAGEMVKFVAVFERPFWRDQGFSGRFVCLGGKQIFPECEGLPINFCFDTTTYEKSDSSGDAKGVKPTRQKARGKATLVGFLTCEKSLQWSQVNPDILKHSVLDTLSEVCGGAAWPHEALHFQVENWSRQCHLGGSGGASRAASMSQFHALRQPHGCIHFAGSETAVRHMGSVAGAVSSGRRAALQVLSAIRPQTLSTADYASLEKSMVVRKEELMSIQDARRSSEQRWIYRWTFVLPMCGLVLGYAAYTFRDKYSSLFVPIHH